MTRIAALATWPFASLQAGLWERLVRRAGGHSQGEPAERQHPHESASDAPLRAQ
ncbi:MAG: hypothetical protein ACK526_20300 [Planctomyces sp.]